MLKNFKKQTRRILLTVLALSSPAYADLQLNSENIDEVVNALTLEEKIALLLGTGMEGVGDGPTVGNVDTNDVDGSAGTTYAVKRLGIPAIVLADGPAGLRISPTRKASDGTFYATAFPIASAVAATWNTDLANEVGEAMGSEALAYGVDVLLAPALNIHRYPLAGRNFEYYSEDPLLSGYMAASVVNGIQSKGIASTIKHFVANNHEWNRGKMDVKVSPDVLNDIYLKGFEIAVKHGSPQALMSSYNLVNGTYTSQSEWLLEDVLRKQWGFNGIVMTDWFGGADPIAQVTAGNDLLMPGQDWQQHAILQAAKHGALDESLIDRNVKRILKLVVNSPTFKQLQRSNAPDLAAHASLARTVASESMVLLENKNKTLPLALEPTDAVALFGNASYHFITGGNGSGDVHEAYSVSLQAGFDQKQIQTVKPLADAYQQYVDTALAALPQRFGIEAMMPEPNISEFSVPTALLKSAAKEASVAVVTLSRNAGEFIDRAETEFYLTEAEHQLLSSVKAAFQAVGKRVIVVLNIGGVIETAPLKNYADAILLAWQPGQEAGHAVSDVLTGIVNPSGRLPGTFAADLSSYPSSASYPGVVTDPNAKPDTMGQLPSEVEYNDGYMLGYRYFNAHPEALVYPFGYGLSYSTFSYGKPSAIVNSDGSITASITVTNNGDYAGREVVQWYAETKMGAAKGNVLAGFAKTQKLAPGERQTLEATLYPHEFMTTEDRAVSTKLPIKLSASTNSSNVIATITAVTQ